MNQGLLLVGYRVVPPWTEPPDPLLPRQVVTLSDHLVDPVPDDGTWYATPEPASTAGRAAGQAGQAAGGTARVLAMGVHERDADEVIDQRLTLDTSQLCLHEKRRTPWPAGLQPLGYEVIGVEACGFHSWLCYGGVVAWADRQFGIRLNAHGLIDSAEQAHRLGEAAEDPSSELPPIPWVAAAIATM